MELHLSLWDNSIIIQPCMAPPAILLPSLCLGHSCNTFWLSTTTIDYLRSQHWSCDTQLCKYCWSIIYSCRCCILFSWDFLFNWCDEVCSCSWYLSPDQECEGYRKIEEDPVSRLAFVCISIFSQIVSKVPVIVQHLYQPRKLSH